MKFKTANQRNPIGACIQGLKSLKNNSLNFHVCLVGKGDFDLVGIDLFCREEGMKEKKEIIEERI